MSSQHPNNAWNSSPSHIARFYINLSFSGFLLAVTTILFVPLLVRSRYFPLKAHGIQFLLMKICSLVFMISYFATFMPLTRQFISIFIIYMPLAYLFPTFLRCWNILLTFQITKSQIELSSLQQQMDRYHSIREKSDLILKYLDTAKSVRWKRFMQRKSFLISLFVVLAIFHAILYAPVLPLFYLLTESIYSILYAYVAAGIMGVIYAAVILVLFIKIVRSKCREDFMILQGIVSNFVVLVAVLGLLIGYALFMVLHQVSSGNLKIVFYACMIPLDALFLVIFSIDTVFISSIIPLVKTFSLYSYYNPLQDEKNVDDESNTGEMNGAGQLMMRILENYDMRREFKKFAATEFSIENVLFYERYVELKKLFPLFKPEESIQPILPATSSTELKDVRRNSVKNLSFKSDSVKKAITFDDFMEQLKNLYQEFISLDGSMALNITTEMGDKVKEAIMEKKDIQVIEEALIPIMEHILIVMFDTFKRFSMKKEHLIEEWKNKNELDKQFREKIGWDKTAGITRNPSILAESEQQQQHEQQHQS